MSLRPGTLVRAARNAIPEPMTRATIDEPSPTNAELSMAVSALEVSRTLKLLMVKEASPSEPGPGLVSVNAARRTKPTGNSTSSVRMISCRPDGSTRLTARTPAGVPLGCAAGGAEGRVRVVVMPPPPS